MGYRQRSGWQRCGLARLDRVLGMSAALALAAAGCGRANEDRPTENASGAAGSAAGGGSAMGGRASGSGGRAGSGGAGLGGSSTGGAAGAADDGLVCNPDGWCWVSPGSIGDLVDDIHGTPDGAHIFAVSARGTVLEQRDGTWSYHDLGDAALAKVHVVADGDVWAGGDGLFHLSEGQWSPSDPRKVSAITDTRDGNVWAILDGHLHRLEAEGWADVSPEPTNQYLFVDLADGVDAQELWALACQSVGRYYQCLLEHWDGSAWSRASGYSPFDYNLPKLVRSGANVFSYGLMGVMLASSAWQKVSNTSAFWSAWGGQDYRIFVADLSGLNRVDAAGTNVVSTEGVRAVWGTSSGDVWVGLQGGGIARLSYDETLSSISRPLQPPVPWEQGPFGDAPVRLWAGADAAWGSSWRDAWRSLGPELEHFDGASWTPLASSGDAVDIAGSTPNDVWFVPRAPSWLPEGNPTLVHWDGASLSTLELPEAFAGYRLTQIESFGPTSVFVAGQNADTARIAHFDGTDWRTELEVPVIQFHEHWGELAGLNELDVWAAGEDAVYHRASDATWTPAFDADDSFVSLAIDEHDLWILGARRAYHRVGDAFVAERPAHDQLAKLDLTKDYVWAYADQRVLRRRR